MDKPFVASLYDELDSLYPDSDGAAGAARMTVAGCNGEVVGVQLMLSGLTPGLPVSVEVSGPHTAFKLFELLPLPVEVNTGARQRSAYLHDDVNDTVLRKAPFYIFEVLKPIYNLLMPAGVSAAVAFKTPVEYCRERRDQDWTFTVTHAGHSVSLALRVEQYPCAVPKAGKDTLQYVNWLNYQTIASYHGLTMGSEPYFRMLRKYLRAMTFSRQNMLNIPVTSFFTYQEDELFLQEERLLKLLKLADEMGVYYFNGTGFCGREAGLADNDEFYNSLDHEHIQSPDEIAQAFRKEAFVAFDDGPNAKLAVTGARIPGEQGERQLHDMASQLMSFLTRHGYAERWVQCCMDEPNDALAEAYHRITRIVHKAMPGVRLMEPVLPTHVVAGCLDVLCPSADIYEQDRAFYDNEVAQGHELYVYTCLTPGGNYCNRMLDMQRLRQVYLGWAPAKYENIHGFLHWGLNQYPNGANPYARSVVMFSEQVLEFHPKRAMFLPAGDFAIFYPGDNEPYLTTRSEAHRIGLEDLCLLQALPAAKREALVAKLFRGFADYDKDIAHYRAARRELLEASC